MEEAPGVNAKEQTRLAFRESLRQVLRGLLGFNPQDASEDVGPEAEELALVL